MAESSKTLEILVKLRDQASRGIKALRGDVSTLSPAALKVSTAFKTFSGTVGASISRIRQSLFGLQGMIAGIGVALSAKSFLGVAASFEAMEIKLEVLTKGRGRETLEELNEWALRMPVNTQEAVSSFTRMMAMGLDPTIEKLGILVDVASIFGDDVLSRVSRQLGQMASSARISAEDLNTIAETGLNVRKYLTEAFGSIEDLQKKVRTGAIDIKAAIDVIWQGMAKEYAGAAAKAQGTWQGIWNTFVSFLVEIQRKIMAAGAFDALKDTLKGINEELDKWITNNKELIKEEVPKWIKKIRKEGEALFNLVKHIDSQAVAVGLIGWFLWGPLGGLAAGYSLVKLKAINDELKRTGTIGADLEKKTLWERLKEIVGMGEIPKMGDAGSSIKELEERIKKLQKEADIAVKAIYGLGPAPTDPSKLPDYIQSIIQKIEGLNKVLDQVKLKKSLEDEMSVLEDFYGGTIRKPAPVKKPPKPKKQVTPEALISADIAALKTMTDTQLEQYDYMYSQGTIKAKEYYDKKKLLLEQSFKDEIDLLLKLRGLEAEPVKLFNIDQTIIKAGQDQYTKLTQLQRQYIEGTSEEREKAVQQELTFLRSSIDEQMVALDHLHSNNLISEDKYYLDKFNIIKTSFEKETKLLEEQSGLESNLKKREEINAQIIQKALETSKTLIQLAQDEANAIKNIVAGRLQVYNDIAQGEGAAFKDINDEKLKTMVDNLALQYQEQKKYFDSVEEGERWLAAKQKELSLEYLASTSIAYNALLNMSVATAEAIGQAFSDYFFNLMTGKFDTLREVAYNALLSIQRIVSNVLGQIATDWLVKQAREFMGNTQAAQALKEKLAGLSAEALANGKVSASLLAQLGPVYALAAAYRVLALAKAAAGMAVGAAGGTTTIRGGAGGGYGFAEGGEIPGRSPHSKADNIPIWATAKEFMQPVKTVQHYGREVMEGLRQRAIPKEIFSALRFPSIGIPRPRMSYAGGGEISNVRRSSKDVSPQGDKERSFTILNVPDPSMVGQYLASPDGVDMLVNIMSSRVQTFRRILF